MRRREVLALGATAFAISRLARVEWVGPPIAGFVADTRFSEARIAATPPVAWRHDIDGDVTALWYDRLDLAWRAPGPVIAGMTGEDALFVLERLAWDRRRRVMLRKTFPAAGGGPPLVRWIIASKKV